VRSRSRRSIAAVAVAALLGGGALAGCGETEMEGDAPFDDPIGGVDQEQEFDEEAPQDPQAPIDEPMDDQRGEDLPPPEDQY
jgi:hypothetical protein